MQAGVLEVGVIMKNYSYLRKKTVMELCEIYDSVNSKCNVTVEEMNMLKIIHYIVGDRNISYYYAVHKYKEVKEKDFDEWYSQNPTKLTIRDVKASLL